MGPRRWAAVLVGFAGVLVMLWPDIRASWFPEEGAAATGSGRSLLVSLLPIVAALAYALMQMMTRRLRVAAQASAMAIYIQGTFIIVGAGFFAFAGDGRHAVGVENESLQFLLRAWTWPTEFGLVSVRRLRGGVRLHRLQPRPGLPAGGGGDRRAVRVHRTPAGGDVGLGGLGGIARAMVGGGHPADHGVRHLRLRARAGARPGGLCRNDPCVGGRAGTAR